jgi:hypothetical protein
MTHPLWSRFSRLRPFVVWCAVTAIWWLGAEGAIAAVDGARAPDHWPPFVKDDVTEFERGLEPARALLSGVRVAGYATDVPYYALMSIGYGKQTRRYFLAQYALAPTRLARKGSYRWLFVDFRTKRAITEHAARLHYAIRWSDGRRAVLEALP